MKASYFKHPLQFKKTSRTSRGEITNHIAYIIQLTQNNQIGYGEASPLSNLSIDDLPEIESIISKYCEQINDGKPIKDIDFTLYPSLNFAFETAQLAIQNNNPFTIFNNSFIQGNGLPINGLVWMNNSEQMYADAIQKIDEGFTCIKFKVGALDFDEECRLIEKIRKHFSPFKIEIRLDANGAFTNDDVREKLHEFSRFGIHSIEQPIKPKQWDLLQEVCAKSPIPIALDEELIGLNHSDERAKLLQITKPAYLILKPTLIGGLRQAEQWINHANKYQIGWWATSALESNIGLNAIAQWCAQFQLTMPQGLGTGSLYTNNIESPLIINHGQLYYQQNETWNLNQINPHHA